MWCAPHIFFLFLFKSCLAGHAELLQTPETEQIIAETEEWLYAAEGGQEGAADGLSVEVLVARRHSVEERCFHSKVGVSKLKSGFPSSKERLRKI